MEIKAGDKVRIKSWEAMEAEFGLDEDGDVDCWPHFTEAMRPMCSETFTVLEGLTMRRDKGVEVFRVEEIPQRVMVAWMVEEVVA